MSTDTPSQHVIAACVSAFTGSVLLAVYLWIESTYLLGTVGYVLYIIGLCLLVLDIIHHSTRLQTKRLTVWILSCGLAVLLSCSAVGLVIMFATFTYGALFGALLGLYGMIFLFRLYVLRTEYPTRMYKHPYASVSIGEHLVVSSHYMWYVLYLLVWVFGVYMAFVIPSNEALWSPWQALHPLYLMSTIIGGLLLVCVLFSRSKTKHILGILILQSILMHLYIPASHVLPWGGDVWRHIGRVEHVLAGEPIRPILFGTDIAKVTVGAFDIPAVFVQSQQYAYNMTWGGLSLLHTVTGASLEFLSIWFIPILWSVLVPILLFYIGYLIFESTRKGLMFSSLLLIPFSLQALGSLTLPVSFGYLVFLFALLFLLFAIRYHTCLLWSLVALDALYLVFVYPIHAIVFTLIASAAYILRCLLEQHRIRMYRFGLGLSCIVGVVSILCIELFAGTSVLGDHMYMFARVKQFIGEFSGYYIASKIRPHDFLSGNIFINHTPIHAFVSSLFSSFRWHMLVFQISVFGLALYGAGRALMRKRYIGLHILVLLASITTITYIIGWYVLDGDRQLIRRMDGFLAISVLGLAWYGFLGLLESIHEYISKPFITGAFGITAVLLVWVGGTSLTSGPDMRVVSLSEYTVATHIATVYRDDTCVLADTWELLVLESKTKSNIIGGGFPIDAQFGQLARTRLYDTLLHAPDTTVITDIASVIPTMSCLIALPIEKTVVPLDIYTATLGEPIETFGEYVLWRVQLQELPEQVTI